MGMYSYFRKQNIGITDQDIPVEVLNHKGNHGVIENGEVNFGEWDGFKIEGYWYKETVDFLKKVANHLDGFVEFIYESEYLYRIIFKDGSVFYQKGRTVWDNKLEELP